MTHASLPVRGPAPSPPPAVAPRSEIDPGASMLAGLKALADGSRLAIFRFIAAQPGEVCACHVVDAFALRQPTIAHHLRVLRDAGLITAEKRGVWVYYAVDRRGVDRLQADVADLVTPCLTPP